MDQLAVADSHASGFQILDPQKRVRNVSAPRDLGGLPEESIPVTLSTIIRNTKVVGIFADIKKWACRL